MSGSRFTLDTNILVYSAVPSADRRHRVAREIVARAALLGCVLTLQAVSEFYAAVTRKGYLSPADAGARARTWLRLFETAPVSAEAIRLALRAVEDSASSYWDALLISTAGLVGCTAVITEDLADGAVLNGVRVVHPFGRGSLSEGARGLLAGVSGG